MALQVLEFADGRVSLVVNGGRISNFIIEAVGLDLWEMLKFKVGGDQGIDELEAYPTHDIYLVESYEGGRMITAPVRPPTSTRSKRCSGG